MVSARTPVDSIESSTNSKKFLGGVMGKLKPGYYLDQSGENRYWDGEQWLTPSEPHTEEVFVATEPGGAVSYLFKFKTIFKKKRTIVASLVITLVASLVITNQVLSENFKAEVCKAPLPAAYTLNAKDLIPANSFKYISNVESFVTFRYSNLNKLLYPSSILALNTLEIQNSIRDGRAAAISLVEGIRNFARSLEISDSNEKRKELENNLAQLKSYELDWLTFKAASGVIRYMNGDENALDVAPNLKSPYADKITNTQNRIFEIDRISTLAAQKWLDGNREIVEISKTLKSDTKLIRNYCKVFTNN